MSTTKVIGNNTKFIPINKAELAVPILNSCGWEVCWKGCVLTSIGFVLSSSEINLKKINEFYIQLFKSTIY